MCGFAGGLLHGGYDTSLRKALERMGELLVHRGPDDSGHEVSGRCGMVHRRLSVIDLSPSGVQPMPNEDGTVWIAYNGETYNYRELSESHGLASSHRFRSRTDTEVLLHLYEELGSSFLERLNGMYALAIWDRSRERLLLARDPFGVKPLFYTETAGGFWFASEIKALLQAPGVERKPSLEALNGYLAYDYVPEEFTPFQGIHELAPGTMITVEPGGSPVKRKFFPLRYAEDHNISFAEAENTSLELLRDSVRRTLIADVPVGVMLSGGMDSSAMTALMAMERGGGDFHTFSLAFHERSFDESDYAEMVAGKFGTTHHRIEVTPDKVLSLIQPCISHIDEPYADGAAIPTWLLAEEAAKSVTVLLSGEGGDEVYAGYDTHAAWRARKLYRKALPRPVRRLLVRPMVRLLPVSRRKLSFEFKARRFTAGAELGVPESHFFWRAVLSGDARRKILAVEPPGEFLRPEKLYPSIYAECEADTELNRLLCIDSSCHLPNDLMIKNDRMTMAHSVEARVPFTDTELFGYLSRVPCEHKMPGMKKKALLRKSMRGILPEAVVNKKKVGLEMPYSGWMRGPLREFTMEYLSPRRVRDTGLFEPAGITDLLEAHQKGRADNGRALWGLLNYMVWHDLYIASTGYVQHLNRGVRR